MHHLVLERWSRGDGPLHRRDPRAKTIALLAFLVAVAITERRLAAVGAAWLAGLAAATLWARLPVAGLLARAALVLPFSATFAAVTWAAGDPARAAALVVKSYLSAAAVLLVAASTPMPRFFAGLEAMGAPIFLLMTAQFLWRYLFVIGEEAGDMRTAAAARGGAGRVFRAAHFRAAAGALAVLFARAYSRAGDIHRAMLARGFDGRFRPLRRLRFTAADAVLAACGGAFPFLLRAGVEALLP